MVKILYVEDDQSLAFVTKDNLELEGYQVLHYTDGVKAAHHIKNKAFDMAILDVMLPEINGFDLADMIRDLDKETPILFLTAKSLKEDRIKGLKLGADDYITKPFSIEELKLKIKIFIKRSNIQGSFSTHEKIGKYIFDIDNLKLEYQGKEKKLTSREAELLSYLIKRPNKIVKRSHILTQIWGKDDYFLGRSLDVFISRLRKYLKEDPEIYIENIHGVGFRLNLKSV